MKPSADLKKNPIFSTRKESPEAPVKTVVDKLSVTEGESLDIFTRSDPTLARAREMAYLYEFLYDSQFVHGYIEMIERMKISAGGQARGELITSLEAGGKLPPEYYTGKSNGRNSDMMYARELEE